MRERDYQAKLIKKLEVMFPGCVILKNDSQYVQGVPDITIFHEDRWAMLEIKISATAHRGPNQEHYVRKLRDMSYASFIHPDNEAEVLDELQQALRPRRQARIS